MIFKIRFYDELNRHPHDCACCTYLGSLVDAVGNVADCYVCGESIIARTGSHGDYESMPLETVRQFAPQMQGLLSRALRLYEAQR